MDISLAFILVLSVLVLGVVGKVVKWTFRIISLIFLIGFVLSLVLGFFVYKDLTDLKENWPDSDKLLLLANDKIYAGMITTFGEGKEPVFVENLEDYQTAYQNKNYEVLLGSNYKLFIFKLSMFEKSSEEIEFGDARISQQVIINAIESDDPYEFIASDLIEKGEISSKENWKSDMIKEIGDIVKFKGILFGMLLQNEMAKDPLFIFKQYNQRNVIIYPESISFKLIKIVPFSLMEGVTKKVIGGVEEKLIQ